MHGLITDRLVERIATIQQQGGEYPALAPLFWFFFGTSEVTLSRARIGNDVIDHRYILREQPSVTYQWSGCDDMATAFLGFGLG